MNSTSTVTFDDGLGSRNIEHINLILIPGKGILPFEGSDIPPIVRVVSKTYSKNGKWSKNIWTVELFNNCAPIIWYQDWETGAWFTAKTWKSAIIEFLEKLPKNHGLTEDVIVQTIRTIFPTTSNILDKSDEEWDQNADLASSLLEAQEKLASAKEAEKEVLAIIDKMEALERIKIETDKIHTRVEAAKDLLKKGPVSLADLKAAIGTS